MSLMNKNMFHQFGCFRSIHDALCFVGGSAIILSSCALSTLLNDISIERLDSLSELKYFIFPLQFFMGSTLMLTPIIGCLLARFENVTSLVYPTLLFLHTAVQGVFITMGLLLAHVFKKSIPRSMVHILSECTELSTTFSEFKVLQNEFACCGVYNSSDFSHGGCVALANHCPMKKIGEVVGCASALSYYTSLGITSFMMILVFALILQLRAFFFFVKKRDEEQTAEDKIPLLS